MRSPLVMLLFTALGAGVPALPLRAQPSPDDRGAVLELPEFVITGKGSIGIRAMRKQEPLAGWALHSSDRAVLAPVVAGRPVVAGTDTVPAPPAPHVAHVSAHGQYGAYRTAEGWITCAFARSPVDFQARADGFATQGSADGATASGFRLGAGAGWRVPDEVQTVGEARVGVAMHYASRTDGLYGSATPARQRTVLDRGLRLGMTQDHGAVPFAFAVATGGAVSDDTASKADRGLRFGGSIALSTAHWNANASADVHNVVGPVSNRSYAALRAGARTVGGPLRYAVGGGVYAGGNTMFGVRTTLAPFGAIELDAGAATLYADFDRRFRDADIASLLAANPYVADGALDSIRLPFDAFDVRAGVRVPADRALSADLFVQARRTEDDAIFLRDAAGMFGVTYLRTTTIRAHAEGRWAPDAANVVRLALDARGATTDAGARVPYVPAAEGALTWGHTFDGPFSVEGTFTVSSARPVDLTGAASLGGVALLDAAAAWRLAPAVTLDFLVRNLLDQRYERWSGYAATRIFAAVGVTGRL